MPHVHFQTNIHQGQEVLTKEQQIYKYNTFIFDIYNNWININDLVNRECIQNTGRILRNKNDYANFYTLDKKLLRVISFIWKGKKIFINLKNQ